MVTRGHMVTVPEPRQATARKREAIVEAAMRLFAERGYEATYVQDVARELGISKASVFQHFGSKEGLFLAAYRRAVRSLPRWLDVPSEVSEQGFFAVVRYWLEHTERTIREDWVPYRVALLGDHATELRLKREINRFLETEDPYGTMEFVGLGIERGELRDDVDPETIADMVDWLSERFQDALVTDELDPALFRRRSATNRRRRIDQFVDLLRSAIGAPPKDGRGRRGRR